MERVETLLNKLQDQFAHKASPELLLLTVQMLQSELMLLQPHKVAGKGDIVSVTVAGLNGGSIHSPGKQAAPPAEEKVIEVLQIDAAEVEAELDEIKKNAEALQQISVQNKPHIVFEPEEDIPTLSHQDANKNRQPSGFREINDSVASNSSLNDRLKQAKIDLGETLTEAPVRDLRKAIGVNDRFLFINELFRGDEVTYERSIKTINSFSIYAEAEYWIQRELKVKNGWDANDPMVLQFYRLVKRRFS